MVGMCVGEHDRIGIEIPEFAQPIKAAINHNPAAAAGHEQGGMHPMPPRPRLDFATRAEKSKFHGETIAVTSIQNQPRNSRTQATARPLTGEVSIVKNANRSPRIEQVSWGRLQVEGKAEPYKDAKLFPGGSREWNWRETSTKHVPGIQIADVQELLDRGAKVLVLSRGMQQCLEVPRETLDFLKDRQIEAHVLPTTEAVELYNKLAENQPVGGLFHTTC
jgi:hypothetical protein